MTRLEQLTQTATYTWMKKLIPIALFHFLVALPT